jgi:hypothetical protein
MKLMSQNHCPNTRAAHPILLWSVGALLGACSLDTAPESSPSRATLETDVETESSTLDTPNEITAGAAAPTPTQTAASIIPPPQAAPEPEPEPEPESTAPAPKVQQAPAPKVQQAAAEPKQAVNTNGCKPGDYEGVIAGTVNFGPLEVTTLTGKINLRLVADENNEKILRVMQGRVEGIDLNKAVFTADVTGAVDCSTGELMQSEVERGMYEDTNEVLKIAFTGVAEGHYSADPPALLGTWNISDDSTLLAGQGTWTTTLAESL